MPSLIKVELSRFQLEGKIWVESELLTGERILGPIVSDISFKNLVGKMSSGQEEDFICLIVSSKVNREICLKLNSASGGFTVDREITINWRNLKADSLHFINEMEKKLFASFWGGFSLIGKRGADHWLNGLKKDLGILPISYNKVCEWWHPCFLYSSLIGT